MTRRDDLRDDLLIEFAKLEAYFRDAVIVTRVIVEPVFSDPTTTAPTGGREVGRLTRVYFPKKEHHP